MAMRRREDPVTALRRRYQPVPLTRIPTVMRRAAMIGEDNRFYQHNGLDYVEMRHALGYPRDSFAWNKAEDRSDLRHALTHTVSHPGAVRGASTITQQLAKNLYLSSSRNPLRKVKEAVTAWRLELWLPKERILELYLDTAEMGREIWGVEAASRAYFHSSVGNISSEQAATLAALLPFPRSSNPDYHPERMLWRKNLILQRLQGKVVTLPADST